MQSKQQVDLSFQNAESVSTRAWAGGSEEAFLKKFWMYPLPTSQAFIAVLVMYLLLQNSYPYCTLIFLGKNCMKIRSEAVYSTENRGARQSTNILVIRVQDTDINRTVHQTVYKQNYGNYELWMHTVIIIMNTGRGNMQSTVYEIGKSVQ